MLTPQQAIARKGKIGGSIMSAVAGVSTYMTPVEAWYVLTGRLTQEPTNEAMELGSAHEPPLLDWVDPANALERNIFLCDPDGLLCGNLDAGHLVGSSPYIVEAKTTGLTGPANAEYTDPDDAEDGSNIAQDTLVQVHHYFGRVQMCLGIKVELALVPVLIGGRGRALFRVRRNDELVSRLGDLARDFMEKHVKADIPPKGTPSIETLKLVRRVPAKIADVSDGLYAAWEAANRKRIDESKLLVGPEDQAYAALVNALGDAEAGRLPDGRIFTYYEIHCKARFQPAYSYRKLQAAKRMK